MCCKYCNDKFFAIPRCFRWRSLRCRIWQETHTPVQAPSSASPKLPACTSSSQSKCRSPFHLDLLVLRLFLFLCLFLLTQLSQVRIKSVCFHLCVCVFRTHGGYVSAAPAARWPCGSHLDWCHRSGVSIHHTSLCHLFCHTLLLVSHETHAQCSSGIYCFGFNNNNNKLCIYLLD